MTRKELIENIVMLLERWEEREAVKRGEMTANQRRHRVADRLDDFYRRKVKADLKNTDDNLFAHRKLLNKAQNKLKATKRNLTLAKKLEASPRKIKEIEDQIPKRERVLSRTLQRYFKVSKQNTDDHIKVLDRYGKWAKHATNLRTHHLRREIGDDKYKPTSTEKMLGAGRRPKPVKKKTWLSKLFGK